MAAGVIRQTIRVPVSPERLYAALLDSRQHSAITGDTARLSTKIGGSFSSFGGWATGQNVRLVPGRLIEQTWRASDWSEGAESTVRFELKPVGKETELRFTQTGVPAAFRKEIASGWEEFYWRPLKAFFTT